VMVWDPSTGAHLHTMEGHSDWVHAVQFSPDGSMLASGSYEKIFMWDLNKISPVETIDVEGFVTDLTFSADGSCLKTNISVFKLKTPTAISHDENASSFHLQVREDWILRHGHKTIWLPPEFRPALRAALVRGAFMAFGHPSGTVSLWEISA
jgi:WD40 repeat protein